MSVVESERPTSTIVWNIATRQVVGEVECAASGWLADGETLLCGRDEEQAWLWNYRTSARTLLAPKFSRELDEVALSDDGRFAVARTHSYTTNNDGRVVVWDLARAAVAWTREAGSETIDRVAISRTSIVLIVDDAGKVTLYDAAAGRELSPPAMNLDGASVAGLGASTLFLSSGNEQLEARELKTGAKLGNFGKGTLLAITASDEAIVKDAGVWQLKPGTDDYHWLHTAWRWNPKNGARATLGRQLHEPLALSPSGTRFVSMRLTDPKSPGFDPVSGDRPVPWISAFPSADRLTSLGVEFVHPPVTSLRPSPDGRSLFLSVGRNVDARTVVFGDEPGGPNQLLSWDLESGRISVRAETKDPVNLLGFTHDGTRALLGGPPGQLASLSGAQPLRKVERVKALVFREGRELSVTVESSPGETERLALREFESSVMVRELQPVPSTHASFGRWAPVMHVWFREVLASPDGRFIVAFAQVTGKNRGAYASAPWGALFLWETDTGKFLGAIENSGAYPIATTFSPDGKHLAFAHSRSVQLYETGAWKKLAQLDDHLDRVAALAFSDDGKQLLSGGGGDQGDDGVRLWNLDTFTLTQVLRAPTQPVTAVTFLREGRIGAATSNDGSLTFWDLSTATLVGRLFLSSDGSWLSVAQDGRYETNTSAEIDVVRWVLPDEPLRALPIELFMRDFYEPRLLPRKLAREPFPPAGELGSRLLVQPEVRVVSVKPSARKRERVDVVVEVVSPPELASGVYDLRLLRDRQLVATWPKDEGAIVLDGARRARVTFRDVQLPTLPAGGSVEFSAYAFNAERIKSRTGSARYTVPASRAAARKQGTAYVVTIGVNAYETPAWNLQFAVNDAERLSKTLVRDLERTARFERVVSVRLLSVTGAPDPTALPATKQNLRAVLGALGGDGAPRARGLEALKPATPDDLLILSFSGHGHAEVSGDFYLLPHDIGAGGSSTVTPAILERSISTDELSAWLRPVDAGEMTLIVDACHSAASIDAPGFKPGPMGSRGLGQLAFDKGMRVLAASQGDDVALESAQVRQGLLSYALVNDGLEAGLADNGPSDSRITMAEWLAFGVDRVPLLFEELIEGARPQAGRALVLLSADGAPAQAKKRRPQKPALFDFAQRRRELPLSLRGPASSRADPSP